MATTGFWPVKGRLKDVINYAQNPDKTTDRRFLDDDLAATLNYVENSDKTDQTMYVSGINCTKKQAYEQMMTTKRRFGKLGGNVAYHGYQSFQSGEVTPEEAHRIGIETARRMWGDDYEIVVTTHLNTANLHNHIVVNSVSFRTGRKFEITFPTITSCVRFPTRSVVNMENPCLKTLRSTAATRRIGYAKVGEYHTRICCSTMLMKP